MFIPLTLGWPFTLVSPLALYLPPSFVCKLILIAIIVACPTDLPPAKRRKGIAETVISTAFNAALVGAAVGLTVFKL